MELMSTNCGELNAGWDHHVLVYLFRIPFFPCNTFFSLVYLLFSGWKLVSPENFIGSIGQAASLPCKLLGSGRPCPENLKGPCKLLGSGRPCPENLKGLHWLKLLSYREN